MHIELVLELTSYDKITFAALLYQPLLSDAHVLSSEIALHPWQRNGLRNYPITGRVSSHSLNYTSGNLCTKVKLEIFQVNFIFDTSSKCF